MKNRFGNVTYDSTLSQGLAPAVQEKDLLAHTISMSFEFQDGVTFTDTLATGLPSLQSYSLINVVDYKTSTAEATVATGLPTLVSYSLVDVITYVSRDIDSDSLATSIPSLVSYSLVQVVTLHILYDAALDRPEDTLAHTSSWEFTLT